MGRRSAGGVIAIGLFITLIAGFLFVRQLVYELSLKHEIEGLVWQQLPTDCSEGHVRFYIRGAAQQLLTQCVKPDEFKLGQEMKLYANDVGDVAAVKGKWWGAFTCFLGGVAILAFGIKSFRESEPEDD